MTLILDAAPIVAMHDRVDPRQRDVESLLRTEPGELVIPAPVTAEVDYLLATRLGERSRQAFIEDIAAGRYVVGCLTPDDYRRLLALERRYEALAPGLADLSVVLVADRFNTSRIATFDQRAFRTLRPLDGAAQFELLPSESV